MAEPKIRFKQDDGNHYPAWTMHSFESLFKKNNERNGHQFTADKTISIASMSFNPEGNGADEESLSTYKVLRIGDVAFEGHENKEFSHGRFVLNDIGDGIMSPRFSCMRPLYPLINGFWKYYIHSEAVMKDILIRATKKGTMMHELVFDDLFKQSIAVPCEEEQQKIADFLSSVDEVISASEQEVANLETQKKAVMKKIFSQEVRFKRADGSDFPEWEEDAIGNMFQLTRGYVLAAPKTRQEQDTEYQYPVFSSQTKNDGRMGYYNEYLYEDAITWTTDGANAGTVKYREGKFYCTNVCGVLLRDRVTPNLCIAEILNIAAVPWVTHNGNPKLMNNVMAEIRIQYPSDIEEQCLIADFLSDFDEAITAAKKELELWKELKKGLLQQMFV